jgi:hypothetical protein
MRAEQQKLGRPIDMTNVLGHQYVTKAQFFRLLSLLYVGARCRLCTSLEDFIVFTDRVDHHQSVDEEDMPSSSPGRGALSEGFRDRAATIMSNHSSSISNTGYWIMP